MNNTNKFPTSKPSLLKSIQAGVQFGAASQNCKGNGICRVVPLQDKVMSGPCQCNTAAWIIRRDDEHIEFRFTTLELKACIRKRYFQNDTFILQEDVFLPEFVQNALKLKKSSLPKGDYSVAKSSIYTSILFPLENEVSASQLLHSEAKL